MTEAEFMAAYEDARRLLGHSAKRLARSPVYSPDDLMQAALAAMWADRAKLAGVAKPAAWMVQAGRWAMLRHVRTHRRRHGRCGHTPLDAVREHDLPTCPPPAPDESAALLAGLPADTARLVWRKVVNGESAHALAAEAGVKAHAVRRRVAAALGQLAAH